MSSNNPSEPPGKVPVKDPNATPVWVGRPSVGPYIVLRAIIALIAIGILVGLELWFGANYNIGKTIFPSKYAGVPYPVEIATAVIVGIIFLISVLRLVSIWLTNKYELFPDGLYVNRGIVNLENAYLAPMAFSDARLYRSWEMRIIKRGQIIVEANDGRKFYLHLVKDPMRVQYLIRETLGHPTVRTQS